MSYGGHNAKPLRVLGADGGYREDRHGQPKGAVLTASGWAGRKPEGLGQAGGNLWDFVTKHRAEWLAESDRPALQALCEVWELRQRTLELLAVDATDKDTRIAFSAYHTLAEKLLSKFGLNPTDKTYWLAHAAACRHSLEGEP